MIVKEIKMKNKNYEKMTARRNRRRRRKTMSVGEERSVTYKVLN